MALTDTDRRRFFLATTLTLLSLPALWWVNQSENSAAPNVAVAGAGAGVDVGADHTGDAHDVSAQSDADPAAPGASAPPVTVAPIVAPQAPPSVPEERVGEIAPVFLGGPSSAAGAGLSEVAVPARPEVDRITTRATYRSDVGGSNACVVPGIINGQTVTIVNLDNGRSVTCITVLTRGTAGDQATLHRSLFADLADLTDAPIPVEIRR